MLTTETKSFRAVHDTAVAALPEMPSPSFRRIGIMGGTFNPPHLGHLIMADQVGKQLALDEVWFMPSATPPHQQEKRTIAGEHREQMVALAIADNPLFRLCTYEVRREGKHYTFDTMTALKQQYPDVDFYFIIGGDMVENLPQWYRIDELVMLVQFVGVTRSGYPKQSPYPIMWVDSPRIDISSSEIRLRIALAQSVKYQVPDAVQQYIEAERLYQYDD